VCRVDEVTQGEARVALLARDDWGRPREAIVLRDERGELRAYRNLCSHLPVPLDAASRRFVRDGAITCATHGARYRLDDGHCISGPCRGQSLRALPVEVSDGDVFVLDDGTA
jgi:nitrite reductase/ring-hydroxylating ferredoxin subunit